MKRVLVLLMLAVLRWADARAAEWQPSVGHAQMPIWPGPIPDAQGVAGPESVLTATNLVAGRTWIYETNVARPTITVYAPETKNTGLAVIVFPGGGYSILAMDLEGTEVCEWLASHGITGVLLKYRVPNSGPHWDPECHCHKDPKAPAALEDAQRAVGLVRANAAQWHVDPHKIAVLGFSAGGHLVANVSTHFDRRSYPAVDAADQVSCRPDFGVAIYPGHMREHTTHEFDLNPTLPVTSRTPPTLLVQAVDDPVDPVENSLVYCLALKKAGVPVELHLYPHGGHAFGLRRTVLPITRWPELMEAWLESLGMMEPQR